MNKMKALLVLSLMTLAAGILFCGRPYFIDDCYHAVMAEGVRGQPSRPYDFRSDDGAENVPAWENSTLRMVNPPLMHYYLAAVISVAGNESWKLRLAFLIFPLLAVCGTYLFALRFTSHAFLSALLLFAAPAFFLSSYALMIDMCALGLLMAGMELFLRGWENNARLQLAAGSILLGLLPLAKYTAVPMLFIPLLWIVINRKLNRANAVNMLFMLIPAVMFIAWQLWSKLEYGQFHILAAYGRSGGGALIAKLISGLSFLSGSTVFTLLFSWIALRKEPKLFIAVAAAAGLLFALFISRFGGFTLSQAALLSVFIANSILILAVIVMNRKRLDPLLVIWFTAGFFLILMPVGYIAARYYLLILPPLAILSVQLMERYFPGTFRRQITAAVLAAGVFTFLLAGSEYAQARSDRQVAADTEKLLAAQAFTGRKFALGDSFCGYAYYLKRNGWRMLFDNAVLQPGDAVLVKNNSIALAYHQGRPPRMIPVQKFTYPSRIPLRVMDIQSSAGFYSSMSGTLPFSLVRTPAADEFYLYLIQ